jgi:hypothetical protein
MKQRIFKRNYGLSVLLIWLIWCSADAESLKQTRTGEEELPASSVLYVSDYFSFIGHDDDGYVAFALDNNRGRDGDAYQAEHFLVLHDEHQGWINVTGNGRYENHEKQLVAIPNSTAFQFQGTPETGMRITSDTNELALKIAPIPQRTSNRHNGAVTWMGSASAVLTWRGRTIRGRVIYEYLRMPGFNRPTRAY